MRLIERLRGLDQRALAPLLPAAPAGPVPWWVVAAVVLALPLAAAALVLAASRDAGTRRLCLLPLALFLLLAAALLRWQRRSGGAALPSASGHEVPAAEPLQAQREVAQVQQELEQGQHPARAARRLRERGQP